MSTTTTTNTDSPTEVTTAMRAAVASLEWVDDAACADLAPEEFFARAGHVLGDEAKAACFEKCTVWRECTIWSYLGDSGQLAKGGYFAGMSPGQRKKMTLEEALAHGEKLRAGRTYRR